MRRLRTRLIVVYAGLILLGFGGLAWLAGGRVSEGAYEDFQLRLESQASLIARSLREEVEHLAEGEGSAGAVAQRLEAFAQESGTTLRLINRRGDLWLSSADAQGSASALSGAEVARALRGEVGYAVRRDEQGQQTAYAAAPILEDGEVLAVLQLATPVSQAQATVWQRWLSLVVGVVALGLLTLLASIWLASTLTRPLEQMRNSALRLAEGDFSTHLPQGRQDEVGEVAKAFNHMADQVQGMLDEQRAFASNASHELRTPLTNIRLRSEVLRHGLADGPTTQRYIEEIDDEATRMTGLVEDLILLSRLDAGRAERGQEWVDVERLARSVLRELEPLARANHVRLWMEVAPALPLLESSENHLRVVLRNLLSNAIKYASDGEVRLALASADDTLHISVADNGAGIDAAALPHIFERFYRADETRGREVPGVGLGLPLVVSILAVYGAELTVESEGVGRGTVATVRWPLESVTGDGRAKTPAS